MSPATQPPNRTANVKADSRLDFSVVTGARYGTKAATNPCAGDMTRGYAIYNLNYNRMRCPGCVFAMVGSPGCALGLGSYTSVTGLLWFGYGSDGSACRLAAEGDWLDQNLRSYQ